MAAQSMIMGEAFGKSYQYGKRKISSMSNEEFNKLTMQDLATQLETDYKAVIPSVTRSMTASQDFQEFIIKELAAIVPKIPGATIEGIKQGLSDDDTTNPFPAAAGITGAGGNPLEGFMNFFEAMANFVTTATVNGPAGEYYQAVVDSPVIQAALKEKNKKKKDKEKTLIDRETQAKISLEIDPITDTDKEYNEYMSEQIALFQTYETYINAIRDAKTAHSRNSFTNNSKAKQQSTNRIKQLERLKDNAKSKLYTFWRKAMNRSNHLIKADAVRNSKTRLP